MKRLEIVGFHYGKESARVRLTPSAWPACRTWVTRRAIRDQTLTGTLTWLHVFLFEHRQPLGTRPKDGDAEGAGGKENTRNSARFYLK